MVLRIDSQPSRALTRVRPGTEYPGTLLNSWGQVGTVIRGQGRLAAGSPQIWEIAQ